MVEGSHVPFRFHVLNRQGERIASAEHVEESLALLRGLPAGDHVVNVVTGETIARKATGLHRKVLGVVGQA